MKLAPEILTGKDLDYLKDIFGWNHTAFKFCYNAVDDITDKDVRELFDYCNDIFYKNMTTVLDILESGEDDE